MDILYKGKILGVCDVILFTTEVTPNIIGYELRDSTANFRPDTWLSNFKPITDYGDFDISKYRQIHGITQDHLVSDLIIKLKERYAAISLQYYAEEITHGTQ